MSGYTKTCFCLSVSVVRSATFARRECSGGESEVSWEGLPVGVTSCNRILSSAYTQRHAGVTLVNIFFSKSYVHVTLEAYCIFHIKTQQIT